MVEVVKKWRHYLEDAEILLKSDAKSLQNVKLDRWSLELQGRNIQVEHIPGHMNKAADFLSQLPFVVRKRNDNPMNYEDVSVIETQVDVGNDSFPLCEVELTDMKALQTLHQNCQIDGRS